MSSEAAIVMLRSGDTQRALHILEACECHDAEWHATRGMALLATGAASAAREDLREVVSLGAATPVTMLNLALAEAGAGDEVRGCAIIQDLIACLPDWDEPWLRLAEILRRAERFTDAEIAYGKVLERNAIRPEALIGLAALRIMAGDGEAAQKLLLRCLGCNPEQADAWDALGIALLQTGDAAAAESAFSEAHRCKPDSFDYALRRAEAALAAGSAEAELARLLVAAMAAPLNATLPTARGALLDRLGRHAEAMDALDVAVALAPDAATPAILLASVMTRFPRHGGAVAALRRALELEPDNQQIANNLGAMLMRQQQHVEAALVLRDLRERHGDDPVCLCNLANASALLGDQAEAVVLARRALELAPNSLLAHRALANALPYDAQTRADDLLSMLRATSSILPRENPVFLNSTDQHRRLRVGLLSGAFRIHPVGWLTIAAFENLDPAEFDIVCMAQETTDDPMTRRFRNVSSGWHDISNLDDSSLAAFARGLGIDILVDLGGYGESGRMSACAQRLAPVQVKWVGMQNHSTGLAEMDWFITDRWETPVEYETLYSERLLRMPDGYVCYSPPPNAPDVTVLPALKNGHVTFGCFNNLAKITEDAIGAWCEILCRLPEARLILKTHQFSHSLTQKEVRQRFAKRGVVGDRLELRGASPHREFMGQYGDVDIVLDPFPYSGGLTTCEALWMGVPTITFPGEIFAARHSFSHLCNVGLHDWIARDRHHYVDLAVEKAADIGALTELRAGLRVRTKVSPLCDAPRFGRQLGKSLRYAWQEWCKIPAPISIP